ncbi:MAG: hypothetical protein EB127_02835 [Alphaproteobacteria bacterium]|nr:hypothetical protein [Alphaproteobacteria bacterium]
MKKGFCDKKLYDFDDFDNNFLSKLKSLDSQTYESLIRARASSTTLTSDATILIAKCINDFLIEYFGIKDQAKYFVDKARLSSKIYQHKRNFVHRIALKKYKIQDIDKEHVLSEFNRQYKEQFSNIDENSTEDIGYKINGHCSDLDFIRLIESRENYSQIDDVIVKYAACRVYFGPGSTLFSKPEDLDFENLINPSALLERDAQDEANYCLKCHKTGKDSCSKGLLDKASIATTPVYQKNPLGNILTGCPLDIRISEMIELYEQGFLVASLAVALEANPLLALTGARICNDCAKACIYQKQRPVDVPNIETAILEEVLAFDYGVEIYYILTNWNPLSTNNHITQPIKKGLIMVVGSGPAGISLSHYLLKSGCRVDLIEGHKIEPLDMKFVFSKIKYYRDIEYLYDKIKPNGFGGVCEYGITERWKKSKLLLIRICLERNENFNIYGGIKFGANFTVEDSIKYGYHHIALALGAGKPQFPEIKHIGSTAGVRAASDFLMFAGLFHSGQNIESNFFIDLPVYVVGGGLTSIDASVEVAKYYPSLAIKLAQENRSNYHLNQREERQIEKLQDAGLMFLREQAAACKEGRGVDFKPILHGLGGVNICYRGRFNKSPSYRQNHEEINFAIKEGVSLLENTEIIEIFTNEDHDLISIKILVNGVEKIVPCGTLLLASGTSHIGPYEYIKNIKSGSNELHIGKNEPLSNSGIDYISCWGDMLPEYQGSVVRAIQSVKYGYHKILDSIKDNTSSASVSKHDFSAKIVEKRFITKDLLELKIQSAGAALNFKSGGFYKLQNYMNSKEGNMEPLAISCAGVEVDILSFYIKIVGKTSYYASMLKPFESVSLMGPLGKYFEIEENHSYLLLAEDTYAFGMKSFATQLQDANIKYNLIIECSLDDNELYKNEFEKIQSKNFTNNLTSIESSKIYNFVYINGSCGFLRKIEKLLSDYNGKKFFLANTLMQCMMGGVCGQCIIESSGKMTFACMDQIQLLSKANIDALDNRLNQNRSLEKIL